MNNCPKRSIREPTRADWGFTIVSSLITRNKDMIARIGNVLLMSIVTQDNRLGAKNTTSYQYRGKRNTWLFHGSIIRRNVRLARDLRRKKFADQKNVLRYSLLMSRKNALDLARLFMPSLFLSFSVCLSSSCPPSQSLFFCFAVPNARCSLRIIKVVANLDWRELRIHSLVSARGNWCLQLQRNFGGLFNWERRCARCRKWKSTLRVADMLKISLKRWKENRSFASRQLRRNPFLDRSRR